MLTAVKTKLLSKERHSLTNLFVLVNVFFFFLASNINLFCNNMPVSFCFDCMGKENTSLHVGGL